MTLKHETVSWEKNEEASSNDMQKLDNLSHLSLPFVKVSFMLCCWPAPQSFFLLTYSNVAAITTKKEEKRAKKVIILLQSLCHISVIQLWCWRGFFCRNIWLCAVYVSLFLTARPKKKFFMQIFISQAQESRAAWENCTHYKWDLVATWQCIIVAFFLHCLALKMLGLEDQFEWKTIAITAIEICRLTRKGEGERSSRSLVLLININEQQ